MTTPKPSVEANASEDDLLRAKELVDRMLVDPAIGCPIKFSWTGNEEQANKVATLVRVCAQVQKEHHSWMSFTCLKEISFYTDYEQGLRDAVDIGNVGAEPSREAGGLSVGMVVRCSDGSRLIMQEGVAHALISEQREHNDLAISIIRHELGHVHDNEFKMALIEKDNIKSPRNPMEARFLPMAESMWSEYFANKYSHGHWSDTRSDFVLMRDALECIPSEIRAAILAYRTSRQLDALLAIAEPKVRFLAQCFGYAIGRLAGLGKHIDEHDAELGVLLTKYGMRTAWDNAFRVLDALDARRPHWDAYWAITELSPICWDIMAACGLRYRPEGLGLYVDVPWTIEAPAWIAGIANFSQMLSGLETNISKRMQDIISGAKSND